MQPKPWVLKSLQFLAGALTVGVLAVIVFYFVQLDRRVSLIESKPVTLTKTIVITPEPTASPSATPKVKATSAK